MILYLNTLKLSHFKGHETLSIEFGDLTKAEGRNGAGKSTIGDAISWLFFGTDSMGSALDPSPIGDFQGDVKVEATGHIDSQKVEWIRAIEGGKNKFYINQTPVKATEFKEYVEALFSKELFLSLYNPAFFSSQHWQKQREQLLKYVEEPIKKEVYKRMAPLEAEILDPLLKKNSLEDLEKIHKDIFSKRDKEIERASEKALTLQDQHHKISQKVHIHIDEARKQYAKLQAQYKEAEQHNQSALAKQKDQMQLEVKASFIKEQIQKQKELVLSLQKKPVHDHCSTCGQELNEAHMQQALAQRDEELRKAKAEGKKLVEELSHIKEQLRSLGELTKPIDVQKVMDQMLDLKAQAELAKQSQELQKEIQEAKEHYEYIRNERNESQSILKAIKSFKEQKALAMVDQVNSLFEVLSVKLFDHQKNGEIKNTFSIEMEGKEYGLLSTAEKIQAGLELIEVLQKLSNTTIPTFIDNGESILNIKAPAGQAIVARVKDQDLTIEKGQE